MGMSNPENLQPPTYWHDMSERERRLFAKLEFLAEGRVARTPLIAATILRNSWEWNMTILPRQRGERYPVDFAALLAFSPSPYHPEAESIEALRGCLEVTETAEHFRSELFQLGEPVFDQLAAYFEDPRRSEDADFPTLAAHTAHFLGSFSPSEQPVPLRGSKTTRQIRGLAVASIGYAGGPDVACLLADGLGWGYTGLEIASWELAGAARAADEAQGYRGQINAVHQLLENRHGEATDMVWAYNELQPMRATIAEVAASGIPVIWIEAPESLIDWEVQNWDKDKGYLMATQQIVAEGLHDAVEQGNALRMQLPELDIPPVPKDTDALFDSYVELAFDAFEWLHRQFGAPELAEADGELSRLFALRR
jgi:hypothetical protein